jgi:hypothetical protein
VANANLVPTRELVLPPLLQPGATRPDPAEESYLADARRYCPRLAYDYAVSRDSPIVRGTQVTAARVVDLVVDGSSWSDILRDNPELDEDDVRSCLWYAVVSDGPFVPGIEIVNDDEAKGVPVKPKPAPPEAAGQPKPADDWDSFGIDGTAVNAGPSTLGPAPAKASEPPPPQPMLLEEDVEPAIDHPMIAGGSPDADDPRNALGPNPFLGLRRQRP